jgi:tRNA A37 threonylcarbamoyladenosine modification protein TsaB
VRAGISLTKGISLGLLTEPRIIGVPTLTVAAAPFQQLAWSLSPTAVICAVVQAGRGRFNWCYFGAEDLLFRPAAEDHDAGTAAELALQLAEHGAESLWLVGEVDDALRSSVEALPRVTALDNISGLRRAGQLARLATLYFAEGISDTVDSLQPLYLRAP